MNSRRRYKELKDVKCTVRSHMDEADKVTSEAPRSLDSDVRFRADSNGNLKLPDYTHQAIQFSVGPFPGFPTNSVSKSL